jgi:transcriptional regulator NrdR family protein
MVPEIGVICPSCHSMRARVYNTRYVLGAQQPRDRHRWRECLDCGARWVTREVFVRLVQRATRPLRQTTQPPAAQGGA